MVYFFTLKISVFFEIGVFLRQKSANRGLFFSTRRTLIGHTNSYLHEWGYRDRKPSNPYPRHSVGSDLSLQLVPDLCDVGVVPHMGINAVCGSQRGDHLMSHLLTQLGLKNKQIANFMGIFMQSYNLSMYLHVVIYTFWISNKQTVSK